MVYKFVTQHATSGNTPRSVAHWCGASYLLMNPKNPVGNMYLHERDGNKIENCMKVS